MHLSEEIWQRNVIVVKTANADVKKENHVLAKIVNVVVIKINKGVKLLFYML